MIVLSRMDTDWPLGVMGPVGSTSREDSLIVHTMASNASIDAAG